MVGSRNETVVKKELVNYIQSLGLDVKTTTKARGNRGFFKEGRIDISKTLDDSACIRVLIHEYAHYINYRYDKKIKNLEIMFKSDDEVLREELLNVTDFVDKNHQCSKLYGEREKLREVIKGLTSEIRSYYPDFKPDERLKAFRKYAKLSNVKYLEKYDRVRIRSWFSEKVYSISAVREDFPDMPRVFEDYIKLRSKLRQRAKITRKISRLNKYYSEPCELFARFIEGLYIDVEAVKDIAPNTYKTFTDLYYKNYYYGLREVFSIVGVVIN